jgi:hypothetical protein
MSSEYARHRKTVYLPPSSPVTVPRNVQPPSPGLLKYFAFTQAADFCRCRRRAQLASVVIDQQPALLVSVQNPPLDTGGLMVPPHGLGQLLGALENDLASCLALLARKSPDCALLVERWDHLPEPIRRAIVALVKSAGPP